MEINGVYTFCNVVIGFLKVLNSSDEIRVTEIREMEPASELISHQQTGEYWCFLLTFQRKLNLRSEIHYFFVVVEHNCQCFGGYIDVRE